VLTAPLEDDDEADDAQGRFEAALHLLRGEKAREAAAALQALARDLPDDDIAPEALFEAAQILEEQLRDPEGARRLYDEVQARYPQSRLSRRAQARTAELTAGLRTGVAPYLAFQELLRGEKGSPEILRGLQRLLAEHPDFALGDRARYLLGGALHEAGRDREAAAALGEVLSRHPGSEWAPRARQLLGQIALARGDFAAARDHFAALSRYGGSLWETAAVQGQEQVARAQRRSRLSRLGLAFVLLYAGLLLFRAAPRLRPLPYELWYYLPVAGFLVVVAYLTSAAPVWRALLALGLCGAAFMWLSGAAARGYRGTWTGTIAGVAGRVVCAAALCYLVVYHGGLLDIVIETLRHGPESD
jgi:outer membrane protein assembly factor BamD (BamD/ComL family)